MSEPLYVGGRRRPGPNRWGYDPEALDLLAPATRVAFSKRPPRAVAAAVDHFADRANWKNRRRLHRALMSRRRRIPGIKGRVQVVPPPNPERTPRGDWRRWIHRACQVIAEHASVMPDGLAGSWVDGKFKCFFNRRQWASLVGCPVKVWDGVVERLVSAGWVKPRRQRRDKVCEHGTPACEGCRAAGRFRYVARVASLCVTDAFWMAAGAWGKVQDFRAKLARRAAKAERKAEAAASPPAEVPAPRQWVADDPDLADIRRQLEAAKARRKPPP